MTNIDIQYAREYLKGHRRNYVPLILIIIYIYIHIYTFLCYYITLKNTP